MDDQTLDDAVRHALKRVVDPCSIATGVPINLIDMALIKDVSCQDGEVRVVLRLTSPMCLQVTTIIDAIRREVSTIDGIHHVTCDVDHDAEWWPSMIAPAARAELRRIRPRPTPPPHPTPSP